MKSDRVPIAEESPARQKKKEKKKKYVRGIERIQESIVKQRKQRRKTKSQSIWTLEKKETIKRLEEEGDQHN